MPLTCTGAGDRFGAIIRKTDMGTIKNVGVSDELLAAMDNAAKAQGKTADQLFEEAGQRLLEHQALDSLIARGRTHAARAGRKPSDAVSAVRDIRRGR
jgi:hypothetical protein